MRWSQRRAAEQPSPYLSGNRHRFDLVITDMTMPGMTGKELAHELRRIRPDIPIILCTGFSPHLNEEQTKAIGMCALLRKPFGLRELAETIRAVLPKRPG